MHRGIRIRVMKIMRNYVFGGLVALMYLTGTHTSPGGGIPAESMASQKILVLGDSITYSGRYVVELEVALRTRYPDQQPTILNLGLPSETLSGLSEEGHAGGSFPRPDLHERLGRVMNQAQPDVVFACYGMNCGIYKPLSSGNLNAYMVGYKKLEAVCAEYGASLILVTPPPFDPLPLINRVTADGKDGPFSGYDKVLETFSAALNEKFSQHYPIAQGNAHLTQYVLRRRIHEPEFILAGDGVHINHLGHHLVFEAIARAIGLDNPITFEVADGASSEGITSVDRSIPLPLDVEFPAADRIRFQRSFNQVNIQLNHRLIPARISFHPGKAAHDQAIFDLVSQKQSLLKDLWLNETGHLRPGMRKSQPRNQTMEAVEKLEKSISAHIQNRPPIFISGEEK